ncbi:MAG: peptidyl-prolyl cis-trans isomerase [Candidatus Binatia bacterium]
MLHFAAIGAALLAVHDLRSGDSDGARTPGEREPIVITAERVRGMRADYEDKWGAPPDAAQVRALVNQVVEEELLYREARRLQLGFGDASVRRRLLEKARAVSRARDRSPDELLQDALALGLDDDVVIRRLLAQKMRLLLQQEDAGGPIPEAAIADYRERHREQFIQPPMVTFTQVYFSARARGDHAAADAAAALVALGSPSPPAAEHLSDPFPLGHRLIAYTDAQLAGRFGKPFADRVLALPPRQWAGPFGSPFGWHLVRVEEHAPARAAPLEAVREPIRLALRKQRAARNLDEGLARLRGLYEVRIENQGDSIAAQAVRDPGPPS